MRAGKVELNVVFGVCLGAYVLGAFLFAAAGGDDMNSMSSVLGAVSSLAGSGFVFVDL